MLILLCCIVKYDDFKHFEFFLIVSQENLPYSLVIYFYMYVYKIHVHKILKLTHISQVSKLS